MYSYIGVALTFLAIALSSSKYPPQENWHHVPCRAVKHMHKNVTLIMSHWWGGGGQGKQKFIVPFETTITLQNDDMNYQEEQSQMDSACVLQATIHHVCCWFTCMMKTQLICWLFNGFGLHLHIKTLRPCLAVICVIFQNTSFDKAKQEHTQACSTMQYRTKSMSL